jgi:septum formation topological specificity factor MinE
MAELMKQDRELGNHAEDLAAQYRRASQDEKEKLMKEVVETVNKHFEVRQQRRKLTLDRMQKELERLRGEIEHRNSQRETLVKDRVKELIGDGGPGF